MAASETVGGNAAAVVKTSGGARIAGRAGNLRGDIETPGSAGGVGSSVYSGPIGLEGSGDLEQLGDL